MLGMAGEKWHLEFTQHKSGRTCPAASADNLLVLYISDQAS